MKTLRWSFALLPLLGIALFYLFTSIEEPKLEFKAQPDRSREKTVARQSQSSPFNSNRVVHQSDDFYRQHAARMEEIDLLEKQAAKSLTPEFQRKMVEGQIRYMEPRYRALFESWNLDSLTMDKALKIIHERETRVMQKRVESFHKGLAGAGEFKVARMIEEHFGENELVPLIGQAHFKELSGMEKDVDAAGVAAVLSTLPKQNE